MTGDEKVKSSLFQLRLENLLLLFSLITATSFKQQKPSLSVQNSVLVSSEEADIMDFDFRASIHSAKHLSALQAARLHADNYSVIHYTDVDNDSRSDFRCPFCDFEIEGPVLCSDFEEEYWSALKNVVCPVCEENLGKDAITQFTHSSSRKSGWKSEKSGIWSGNSAMLGKKLATRGNKQESIPDPLLSPFVCNVPIPNANSIHPGENSIPSNKDIDIHNAKRSETDAPDAGAELDQQERGLRAAFVQNLILSTIFEETCS